MSALAEAPPSAHATQNPAARLRTSMAAVRANERSAYMKKAVGGFGSYFAKKPYSTYHKVGAAVQ